MTRFHFERPDGNPKTAQTILIHLNEFVPPEGFGGGPPPPALDIMAYEDLDVMAYEPANWLNAQWQKRIPQTINGGQVPTTQTDFPLLINDTFTDLIGATEAELRFASTNDIQLDYEIEKFDTVTGELIAWIKKPSVSDGDIIYIYFDNSFGVVDEQDPAAVWSNNFVVVYHMNQSSGDILDSTINSNDGTPFGSPTNAPGQIGDAKDFPGSSDGFFALDNASLDTTDITVSAWINPDNASGTDMIASKWFNPSSQDWQFVVASNILLIFTTTGLLFGGTVPNGVFTHVAFTVTGGGSTLSIYVNGVFITSTTSFTKLTSSTSRLQNGDSGGNGLVGIHDEFRISNDGKSADWIETEFNNQKDTSIFYATGAVELVPTTFDRMAYEVQP